MKPISHEEHIRHTFDNFCKKVLKHEAIHTQKQEKQQQEREVSFSELSEQDLKQFFINDEYPIKYFHFNVAEYHLWLRMKHWLRPLLHCRGINEHYSAVLFS